MWQRKCKEQIESKIMPTNTQLSIQVEGIARRASTNVRARYVNTSPIGTVITVTFINICKLIGTSLFID